VKLVLKQPEARVHTLRVEIDDAALVTAMRRGDPSAPASIYDRHAAAVRRVLARVLGVDQELPDLLHEVFAQAFTSIHKLRDDDRLGPWLIGIAVFTAHACIRRRKRQRWLRFFAPEEMPEVVAPEVEAGAQAAARQVYAVLDRLPAQERIMFALRWLDGMELQEIADACGVSLATAKRKLHKARERFDVLARRDPILREWVDHE
jgi:RNA polymerase sigma-70 factor, ECF subfamily